MICLLGIQHCRIKMLTSNIERKEHTKRRKLVWYEHDLKYSCIITPVGTLQEDGKNANIVKTTRAMSHTSMLRVESFEQLFNSSGRVTSILLCA